MYERTIDLMDECVSPRSAHSHYAQKENPRREVTRNCVKVPQSNDEIIDFVVKEMTDTLGEKA